MPKWWNFAKSGHAFGTNEIHLNFGLHVLCLVTHTDWTTLSNYVGRIKQWYSPLCIRQARAQPTTIWSRKIRLNVRCCYESFILQVANYGTSNLAIWSHCLYIRRYCFFKKMGQSWSLFHLFSSFQTNITIFITNICEKCPSSIWSWDSNPQPSGHESPLITTRPGFLPNKTLLLLLRVNLLWSKPVLAEKKLSQYREINWKCANLPNSCENNKCLAIFYAENFSKKRKRMESLSIDDDARCSSHRDRSIHIEREGSKNL